MTDPADTPDLRRAGGPHVFVPDLDAPVLDDADRHHLAASLRLRTGDPLTIGDGAGRWRTCRFGDELDDPGPIHKVAPTVDPSTICFALTKGSKPELVIQKSTELGVDRIVVFSAERSVVRWDESKRERTWDRLERVVREAAMQSRRVRLPELLWCPDVAELARTHAPVRADFDGEALTGAERCVAVGPEGGFTEAERALLTRSVDLGPTVLRAETAAIAAVVLMTRHGQFHPATT